jgi:hypothetical protein
VRILAHDLIPGESLVVSIFWFLVLAGSFLGMCLVLRKTRITREKQAEKQRGFEVNLNSGGMPELQKKENDHG